MKNIITLEDVKKEIHIEYVNKLNYYFDLCIIKTDIRKRLKDRKYEYSFNEERCKDPKRIIKSYIEEKQHRVFYDLFGIEKSTLRFSVEMDGVLLKHETHSPKHYELVSNSSIRLLSSIEDKTMNIIVADNNIASECNWRDDIISFNYFTGECYISYQFDYVDNIDSWTIIEHSDRYLECMAYYLDKDDRLPLWKECILTSFAHYDLGNERMAFFNAFTAIDQCIEIMYEALLESYKKYEHYTICQNVEDDAKIYIIKRVERYSNNQRRLVEEKLKDCLKEAIEGQIEHSELIDNLNKFVTIRNNIAHCNSTEDNYQFLLLIWSLLNLFALINCRTVVELFDFVNY